MASTVTPAIRWLAKEMDDGMDYPSAVNSGIIGDLAHNRSGYHFGANDQRDPNNYSVTRFDDRRPQRTDDNAATAIDTSKSTADMVKSWYRVEKVWNNRTTDPRAKYFNAYNGWNGTGSAERLDFVTGARTATDASHKWHDHTEARRRYANDMTAMRAIASVLRGETVEQWLAGGGAGGSDGEDDWMSQGEGLRRLTNADENWGFNGLMKLKDKVPFIGSDGKVGEVVSELAATLKETLRRVKNADESVGFNGILNLAPKVKVLGSDGKPFEVDNKLAQTLTAIAGTLVQLNDRIAAIEAKLGAGNEDSG